MNECKASIVVMSHLSDAQELIGYVCGSSAIEDINFAKYIILHCKGDLNQDINPDELYKEFKSTQANG